ncbi:uncharacterized protein SPPG_00025 [Spizellomyces punctatus DAOM BR117]|uniref:Uncharacterized protein n=1 Tax=Spizellomyces punctatus (strain DAOM BR117) TaxID=645134 RepID=A0A0L0HTR2_SPIPD|nr:uncharacterized protein SPPG_00025 [Spizellomyces punctatus DAOM BR117]KND04290.1 hypothetical protein SPPG_00025 [Spizellomyces punctatus DAOM BR117]|eukprot:XP_016612329.1 hypothetical protein SPPG_00025 [Spizellomyces punctatus DAOM BR117]
MTEPNAHQEVLQFLQDLDSIVPGEAAGGPTTSVAQNATPTTHAASSQDVLSFLNELDAPPVSSASPSASTIPSQAPPVGVPASKPGQTNPYAATSSAPHRPPVVTSQRPPQGFSIPAPSPVTSQQTVPQQTNVPLIQPSYQSTDTSPTVRGDAWGWGNIWSQAAKVSGAAATSLTKGLETAKAMAEETAKAVSTNEKVKGIISNVNKEQFEKLGTDITRLTQSVVDTIAPPIGRGDHPSTAMFASNVTVWFCGEASGAADLDNLHDFVQSTVNEMWLNSRPRLCDKVSVNSVKHPEPKIADSLEEATKIVESTIERLHKLSDSSEPIPTASQAVFLVIQPFTTTLTSLLSDSQPHLQYYTVLVSGDTMHVATSVSQSVAVVAGEDGLVGKWAKHQKQRVLETAMADVCEEFAVRCQQGVQVE